VNKGKKKGRSIRPWPSLAAVGSYPLYGAGALVDLAAVGARLGISLNTRRCPYSHTPQPCTRRWCTRSHLGRTGCRRAGSRRRRRRWCRSPAGTGWLGVGNRPRSGMRSTCRRRRDHCSTHCRRCRSRHSIGTTPSMQLHKIPQLWVTRNKTPREDSWRRLYRQSGHLRHSSSLYQDWMKCLPHNTDPGSATGGALCEPRADRCAGAVAELDPTSGTTSGATRAAFAGAATALVVPRAVLAVALTARRVGSSYPTERCQRAP
jgi:hypothetical protein